MKVRLRPRRLEIHKQWKWIGKDARGNVYVFRTPPIWDKSLKCFIVKREDDGRLLDRKLFRKIPDLKDGQFAKIDNSSKTIDKYIPVYVERGNL